MPGRKCLPLKPNLMNFPATEPLTSTILSIRILLYSMQPNKISIKNFIKISAESNLITR